MKVDNRSFDEILKETLKPFEEQKEMYMFYFPEIGEWLVVDKNNSKELYTKYPSFKAKIDSMAEGN